MSKPTVVLGIAALVLLSLTLACSEDSPTNSGGRGRFFGEHCPAINEFVPVERIAEMIYYEVPQYPRLAEQAGLEGIVWIKAQVNKFGCVEDAVVFKTSGTPALDEAALMAAQKCRFKPGIRNGQPVCMWVTYKVVFSLY